MDIEFDFKGDPLGGVISNCEYELPKLPSERGLLQLSLPPKLGCQIFKGWKNCMEEVAEGRESFFLLLKCVFFLFVVQSQNTFLSL